MEVMWCLWDAVALEEEVWLADWKLHRWGFCLVVTEYNLGSVENLFSNQSIVPPLAYPSVSYPNDQKNRSLRIRMGQI
jgi:hypothetical protein